MHQVRRYAGLREERERERTGIASTKKRKRNETRDANKRDYLNARRGWK
jgi:hypothetical protein